MASFSISVKDTTRKFNTFHITTSTGAQLTALCAALQFISDKHPQKWTIFSDSEAALQSLVSPLHHGPYEQLVFEIAEKTHHFTEKGQEIAFQLL